MDNIRQIFFTTTNLTKCLSSLFPLPIPISVPYFLSQLLKFPISFEAPDSMINSKSVPSNIFASPSKLGIYLCKIPTTITETLIVKTSPNSHTSTARIEPTISEVKPVFHLANLFARTSKKRMWLAGDDVSVCRQPIKLLFSLFARTNSPSGKQA